VIDWNHGSSSLLLLVGLLELVFEQVGSFEVKVLHHNRIANIILLPAEGLVRFRDSSRVPEFNVLNFTGLVLLRFRSVSEPWV